MADTTPKDSVLAQKIAAKARQQHIIYERQRKRWMQYEAVHTGIWSEIDDDAVAERVDTALAKLCKEGFSARTLDGVMRLLKVRLGRTLKPPSRDDLPCRNGVLHLPTMELRTHSPDHDFTWRLPYDYNPLATCPNTQDWLSDTVLKDDETVGVLRAYLRAILTSRVDLQRFLELIGPGGRGKGTYTRLAQALVGQENVAVSNLKTLEGSRFETAGLVDKKLLILSDEERFTGSVATLKALTGEDSIRIERKHHDKGQAANLCMVLISANEAILSPDYTSGLARRRLTVHFANKVTSRRQLISLHTGQPTGELADELPGLLNWVLQMSDEEMVARLTTISSPIQVITKVQMLVETNPLAAWAEDCLMVGDADDAAYIGVARRLPASEAMDGFEREDAWLYANYRGWMLRAGFKDGVSLTRFSSLLVDLCHDQLGLDHVFKPPKDESGFHIMGIRFRTEDDGIQPGLVSTAISAQAVLQGPEGCLKATAQETEDSEDSEDFFNNNHHRARVREKFDAENPSNPSDSSDSSASACRESFSPFSAAGSSNGNGHNPRHERDQWPYGRHRV